MQILYTLIHVQGVHMSVLPRLRRAAGLEEEARTCQSVIMFHFSVTERCKHQEPLEIVLYSLIHLLVGLESHHVCKGN